MSAITACRTAALGGHVEACDDCGATRIAYNSCRNRHCPRCQGPARAAWLAARQAELLPVPYFHVVFTLPQPVAAIRVGRHRVGRLMRLMGLAAIYQAPRTSEPHPAHRIYPYLLKGLAIERPNRVWYADITYIPV